MVHTTAHASTRATTHLDQSHLQERRSNDERASQYDTSGRESHIQAQGRTPLLGDPPRGYEDLRPINQLIEPVSKCDLRELNDTNAQTTSAPVFRTKCIVDGYETYAMIESGASGMFILAPFVQRHGIATRRKKVGGYKVTAVDGSPLPDVDSETMPLQLVFRQHHEMAVLYVMPMARHDVVLGTPWLERHDPHIEWRKRVLTFERCCCIIDINPLHRPSSMKDEERPTQQFRQPTTTPVDDSSSTDASKVLLGHEVRTNGGSNAPPTFLKSSQNGNASFRKRQGSTPCLSTNHGITGCGSNQENSHHGDHSTRYHNESWRYSDDGSTNI